MSALAARFIRQLRRQAGLSKRELARRAATSPAALVGYETGRRDVTVATLARVASAAGYELRLAAAPAQARPDATVAAARLQQVLELAEHLPRRPARPDLDFPSLRALP